MSPVHRDADHGRLAAPTWESLTDRLIREARERGEWDDTAYHGRPLPPPDDEAYAGDRALANRLLRNAGAAPPWIEADKSVRRLLAERDALLASARRAGPIGRAGLRRRLVALVGEANEAIRRLDVEAPTARQQRPRLDLTMELAAFDADERR